MNQTSFKSMLVVMAAICLFGCSRQDKWEKMRPKVYAVSGTVRQDGKPLADAIVSFSPKDGQYGGTAVTDSEGNYQLTTFKDRDGVTEGEFLVAIEKNDWIPQSSAQPAVVDGPSPVIPLKKVLRTAPKFGDFEKSGLTAVVTPKGPNRFEFDLDSQAK